MNVALHLLRRAQGPRSPRDDGLSGGAHTMELALLMDEARGATPARRILWRDRIAAFGDRAIDGVLPWISDPALAAFAIRVIERAGEREGAEEATRVLRAARRTVPAHLQADIDWALARLRTVAGLGAMTKSPRPTVRSDPPVREIPRFSTVARRRHR